MKTKKPQCDPVAAFQREATAARRNAGRRCACGESRPEALIPESEPTICAKCYREKKGHNVNDNHHPAGKANSPETIPTPVNDHRAELSVAQQDWPKETLLNRDGCPVLKGAACVRGVIDYFHYLIDKCLVWLPEMLEQLSAFLKEKLGSKWWVGSPLEQFAPGVTK
jgi:hypothetical protein